MTMYDDDLDVPEFMNRPRGTTSEITRPAIHYKEPINGRVSNVNRPVLTRMQHKAKIRKRKVIAGVLITTHLLAAIIGANIYEKTKPDAPQPSLPNGYILMQIRDRIEVGETITGIANEYYDVDTYSGMYSTALDYTSAILEQNGLRPNTTIHPGDAITVPVIVNQENEIYVQMQAIRAAIDKVEAESLWVPYVLRPGEGMLDLAAKASGSIDETYAIVDSIQAKNSGSRFWVGDTVWIMNPELGRLKTELHELEDALQQSLSQANQNAKTH